MLVGWGLQVELGDTGCVVEVLIQALVEVVTVVLDFSGIILAVVEVEVDNVELLALAAVLDKLTVKFEVLVVVFRLVVELVIATVFVELFGVAVVLVVKLEKFTVRLTVAVGLLIKAVGLEGEAGLTVVVVLLGVIEEIKLDDKLVRFLVELVVISGKSLDKTVPINK